MAAGRGIAQKRRNECLRPKRPVTHPARRFRRETISMKGNHLRNDAVFLTTILLGLRASEVHAESFSSSSTSGMWWFLAALVISGSALTMFWLWNQQREEPAVEDSFSEQCITQTFISALPTLTRELNLEIAKSCQTETLERVDTRTILGINLGTNQATIRAPITYRYHLRLQDAWQLSRKGNAILVKAPVIRASLPPAIHTDQMEIQSSRGWCRSSPVELVQQLHRVLTPTLCSHAEDPRRISFIRETARHSVAEFVRLWLEKETRWSKLNSPASTSVFRMRKQCLPNRPFN